MKNWIFLFLLASFVLLASCDSEPAADKPLSQDELSELIQALQGTLEEQKGQLRIDSATAYKLIGSVEEFEQRFPQDTLVPRFLFQSAAAARGIGEFEKAVELWSLITTSYNNYQRAPDALFLQALTLDENMKALTRAQLKYEAFVGKYPNHPLANDARLLLKAIRGGKSANELVKEFQQQQQQKE